MGKQFRNKRTVRSQNTKKEEVVKEEAVEPKPKQQAPLKAKKEIQKIKSKKNRIIIRNLVFDVSDKHLRKLLLPFGEIKDIEIPKNPNNEKLNKGFAFVEFVNRRSGQKAIKDLNQSTFKGRSIVLDFSLSKQKFMTAKLQNEEKMQDENAAKDEAKAATKKEDEEQSLNEEQQDNKEEAEEPKYVPNPDEDCSSTIFIRNLPPNIDEEQLKQFFARYGKVKWAKIVIDKQTKTPKGTAFVKYADAENAQSIIQYSRSYQMFLLGKLPRFRKDPRYSLEMEGTIVKIFPVQKRQKIAEKLKQRAEAEQDKTTKKLRPLKKMRKIDELIAFDKQGKRRIDLAAFGLWEPNEDMKEQDQQRFKAHYKEKIEKLKNPNYSVSDKRIILKFLDKSITEEQIKNLVHEYLRNVNLPPRQLSFCKLMLDKQRQKSAGFAFIEFTHHETSKNFVEALALHESVLMKRPFVVQFALQDSRKLLKQQRN